ncbi:carboxypeptidase regulatory-like domain-containing protein, partial [Bacteroidales bacterium AH-315-I05]|nr:carboxypeptidase regulatory-like domain-containing protein [Bacteroidales bacterium AH-315-I05]
MIRFFKLTFLCWVFLAFHPVFGESGNDCENAVVINPISCDVFNNTNITGTIAPSCIGAGKNNSMWFSFIADSSGTTISVDGGAGNLPIKNCSVALFESSMDCNGSFLELDCSSSDDDFTEITNYTLVPNNTYYILLDGKNNNQGTFRLCLNSFSVHSISIKGKVSQKMTTLRGLQNMLITIKDERGAFVTSVTTDHAGIFEFRKLQPNKNYILSLDEKNPRFDHNVKYVIAGHVFANNGKKSTTQDMQIFFGYRYDEKLFAMVT